MFQIADTQRFYLIFVGEAKNAFNKEWCVWIQPIVWNFPDARLIQLASGKQLKISLRGIIQSIQETGEVLPVILKLH